MQTFEYKVVPAPQRGEKVRGARTTGDRFAAALMAVMNDLGRDGWEYLRADTLPCEERVGLTGKSSTMLNMLVFRRPVPAETGPVPADRPDTRTLPVDDHPGPVRKWRRALLSAAPRGPAPPVAPVAPVVQKQGVSETEARSTALHD